MDMKKYIHYVVMFALIIGIGMMEPFGMITPIGMKVLGVFVGVLYGWLFIDLVWPSVFAFILIPLSGAGMLVPNAAMYGPQLATLSSGFGNITFLMVAATMIFAGAMEESGASSFLGNWMLRQKFFRKSPWLLIAGILVTAYLLGMANAVLAGVMMLWSIVIRISDMCGLEKQNKLVSFLLPAIVIVGFYGSYTMPFAGGALMHVGFHPIQYDYIDFFIFTNVIFILTAILFVVASKFVFKLDASAFVLPEEIVTELETVKATPQQKVGLAVLVGYIVLLFASSILPNVPGMQIIAMLGVAGMSILAILIMGFVPVQGKTVVNIATVFSKHTPWTLFLLLAATFPLADLMKSADTGIMATINTSIMPIVSNMGLIPFIVVSVLFLGIVTQITHNMVLAAMFMPFLCPIAGQMGGPTAEIIMWFMIFIILNSAYCTPAASMGAALVHGHERMIKKYAYIFPTVQMVLLFVILLLVGYPLGNMLF